MSDSPTQDIHDLVCPKLHSFAACLDFEWPLIVQHMHKVIETARQDAEYDAENAHERGYHDGWKAACEAWGVAPDAVPGEVK